MSYVWLVLGWLFAILFGSLLVLTMLLNNWFQALVLLLMVLLCLPPVSAFVSGQFNLRLPLLLRGGLILVLLFLFIRLLLGPQPNSIYKSPEVRARLLEIYDEKMADWPVPYEDRFLDTEYGQIHVIVSGPPEAPPLLLLHASGVGSWSWKHNVGELSQHYRIYAVDTIGDAGKSEYANLENVMRDGRDQAELYTEITEKLGVDFADVVGASEGGFIATNYALYAPERVRRMVLLGPMGYSGAVQAIMRIMFTQFFPLRPIAEGTFRWAFSESPQLDEEFGEWFPLLMSGTTPMKVAPFPFSPDQRQSLQVPVLFVFGERDRLVGAPERARSLVQDIPDVQLGTVEAGHLMAAELPEEVNSMILEFLRDG